MSELQLRLSEQVARLESDSVQTRVELDEALAQLDAARQERDALRDKLEAVESRASGEGEALVALERRLDDSASRVDALSEELDVARRHAGGLDNELALMRLELERAEGHRERLDSLVVRSSASWRAQVLVLQGAFERLSEAHDAALTNLDHAKSHSDEVERRLSSANEVLARIVDLIAEIGLMQAEQPDLGRPLSPLRFEPIPVVEMPRITEPERYETGQWARWDEGLESSNDVLFGVASQSRVKVATPAVTLEGTRTLVDHGRVLDAEAVDAELEGAEVASPVDLEAIEAEAAPREAPSREDDFDDEELSDEDLGEEELRAEDLGEEEGFELEEPSGAQGDDEFDGEELAELELEDEPGDAAEVELVDDEELLESIAPILDLVDGGMGARSSSSGVHAQPRVDEVAEQEESSALDEELEALEPAIDDALSIVDDDEEVFAEAHDEEFVELLEDDASISHFHIPPPDADSPIVEMSVDGLGSVDGADGLQALEDMAGMSSELLSIEMMGQDSDLDLLDLHDAGGEATGLSPFDLDEPPSSSSGPPESSGE